MPMIDLQLLTANCQLLLLCSQRAEAEAAAKAEAASRAEAEEARLREEEAARRAEEENAERAWEDQQRAREAERQVGGGTE